MIPGIGDGGRAVGGWPLAAGSAGFAAQEFGDGDGEQGVRVGGGCSLPGREMLPQEAGVGLTGLEGWVIEDVEQVGDVGGDAQDGRFV